MTPELEALGHALIDLLTLAQEMADIFYTLAGVGDLADAEIEDIVKVYDPSSGELVGARVFLAT